MDLEALRGRRGQLACSVDHGEATSWLHVRESTPRGLGEHAPRPDRPEPLKVTPWLLTKGALPLLGLAAAVLLAQERVELLLSVVVLPLAALGLVGRHGITTADSRIPPSMQGVCVGLVVGVVVTVTVLDGWYWPAVGWIMPMMVLYPAVLPARFRRPLTARIEPSDVARDEGSSATNGETS